MAPYSEVLITRGGGNTRGGVHIGSFSIEGGVSIEGGGVYIEYQSKEKNRGRGFFYISMSKCC